MEKKEREHQYSSVHNITQESLLASRIRICSPATALHQLDASPFHWFYWQAGVLFPYGSLADPMLVHYYGGLTRDHSLFVCVPTDLVLARRQHYLLYIARCALGTDDQEQLTAYCEQAEREIAEDITPREHPAFEADALARQVAYWLGLLSYRQEPQTADWRW